MMPPSQATRIAVACGETAFEDGHGQGILELRLDRALQRPRAINRIEAGRRHFRQRAIRNLQPQIELRQALFEIAELDLRDRA
jgi:hypothetical protein